MLVGLFEEVLGRVRVGFANEAAHVDLLGGRTPERSVLDELGRAHLGQFLGETCA